MTAERAAAYADVTRILGNAAPAKLHPAELITLRTAADEMVFADQPLSDGAMLALRDALQLLEDLVECDRWTPDGAERLASYIEACAGATETAAA